MSDPQPHHQRVLISRRQLLASTGVLTAAAGAGVGFGTWAIANAATTPALHASTFTALIGHAFRFAPPGTAPVWLTLESVEGVGRSKATELSFSLRFAGPRAARQGGEVGTLTAPGLSFLFLVVPSGRPTARGQDWVVTVAGGGHHD